MRQHLKEIQMSKQIIVNGLLKYYEGIIALAQGNIEIYMERSVGIGEHADILEAVDGELEKIAAAEDKIEVLKKYF